MQKRATIHRLRFIVFSLVIVCFASCDKYYYVTAADKGPTCWASQFTCTIDNNTPITGYITIKDAYGNEEITENSQWSNLSLEKNQYHLYFNFTNRFTTVECTSNFDYDGRFNSTEYDYNYMEETIFPTYRSSGQLTKIVSYRHYFTSDPDYTSTIDAFTYNGDGNITGYRYTERLDDYPYTKTEMYYEVDYDLTKVYDLKLFPNNQFFASNHRPILDEELYSLGELFDPQVFSKNLVTKKRNVTLQNKTVFEKEYQFDGSGRISEITQTFSLGAQKNNSINWKYQYTCE
ncbi:hypothetical protein BH09BAC1_BH09BAC1_16880 [soil metagenome]